MSRVVTLDSCRSFTAVLVPVGCPRMHHSFEMMKFSMSRAASLSFDLPVPVLGVGQGRGCAVIPVYDASL